MTPSNLQWELHHISESESSGLKHGIWLLRTLVAAMQSRQAVEPLSAGGLPQNAHILESGFNSRRYGLIQLRRYV